MNKGFIEHIQHAFETPFTNSVLIFTLILFIILLSPILLRRIKIPGIIGLIVSGVIIGPHALNILERNSAVDLFSTIGLLYIMFIAGLELDLNEFRKTRHKSLTFGIYTFIIPAVIGYPVCHFILGYDVSASLMIASMFATHTLVSYPVVNSYGITKNEAVAITVGGTILTDTAVLIVLAIIIGSSQGQLDQEFWIRLTLSFAIFIGIMFGIIPRIAKWFFEKVESEKTSHYIFVLLVVFFAAFLAEVCGLEPIIGAFMAGLALNKLIPHSSALMNRIEFIGNSIFIPFFLISVGMVVDVSVIFKGPEALYIAGALTITAIFGKYIASVFTKLTFKYTSAQQQLIFGLSSAHAAATLAVIMVGYRYNIIDENVLNGTIVVILVTCVVATLLTESASKKIVLAGNQDEVLEEPNQLSEEHILLPIANLNNMEPLLDMATLIRNKKSPHQPTILSVVPNNEMAEANLKNARKNLDSIAKYASGTETEVNIMATIDYNIAGGISRASREILATAILIGWPNKASIIDKLVGEKTESILNLTDVSLFMCRLEKPLVSQKRIVLFVPPMAEAEKGFHYWLNKVSRLTQELSLPVVCVCNTRSKNAVDQYLTKSKISININFELYEEWETFQGLSTYVKPDDFVVFVSARIGDVSYNQYFDSIPRRVGKIYKENNLILVFPSRRKNNTIDLTDIHHAPYSPGKETVEYLGRKFGSILKKD